MAFSSLGLAAGPAAPYGINAHIHGRDDPERSAAAAAAAGIGSIRAAFDWDAIERPEGSWNFERSDMAFDAAERHGLKILPILGFGTRWASPAYMHLDRWAEYVRRFVGRYGKRITEVEVWNEENCDGFWKSPNPTNYLPLLKRTWEAVKSIDPGIRVSLGGTSGIPFDFIEEVYALGGAEFFDVLSVHPYTHPCQPEGNLDVRLEMLREVMARHGDADKPIWITEMGWPTLGGVPACLELLAQSLAAADPSRQTWRVAYIPALNDDGEHAADSFRRYLPPGSTVRTIRPDRADELLTNRDYDAVVFPFSEYYPADATDAVFGFVRDGGVLVEFGGMPLWYPCGPDPCRVRARTKDASPVNDRRRFRISEMAWWSNPRCPKSVPVFPAPAARGVASPSGGFEGTRFFTDGLLKPGDRFVPLLSAETNGMKLAAAAVMKFGSDMKGAVALSGLYGTSSVSAAAARQADFIPRALGIAFAEGVEAFFVYELRQKELRPDDPESYFGIVRGNFTPGPAYGAYAAFIANRPAGSVQLGARWKSDDGRDFFPQWTLPDGTPGGMFWTLDGPSVRTLRFCGGGDIVFTDASGTRLWPKRDGNGYCVSVLRSPVYFQGGRLQDSLINKGAGRDRRKQPPDLQEPSRNEGRTMQ